jgi:hypothetical protein
MEKIILKKCSCGKLPEIIIGNHHSNQQKVFSVECRNSRCKYKPATGNYATKSIAVSMWNNDVVTNHLMSV